MLPTLMLDGCDTWTIAVEDKNNLATIKLTIKLAHWKHVFNLSFHRQWWSSELIKGIIKWREQKLIFFVKGLRFEFRIQIPKKSSHEETKVFQDSTGFFSLRILLINVNEVNVSCGFT